MKTYLNKARLGVAALGALTLAIGGCAADTDTEENTGTQEASITARGIAAIGCGANGVFNIAVPSSFTSTVDWIALDQSAFTNATSQLSAFNAQNQQQLVANKASQISSNVEQMINQATNFTNAFQASQMFAQQAAQAVQNTSLQETAFHQDSTVATSDVVSTQWTQNSGAAANQAAAFQNSANSAVSNQNATNVAAFNSLSSNFAAGGGAFAAPVVAFGIAAIGAPFFSSAAFASNFGVNASNVNASQALFNNAGNFVASNNFTNFANAAATTAAQHTATAQANQWARSLNQNSTDAMSSLAQQSAFQSASQAAAASSLNSAAAANHLATFAAFDSLSSLNATNFVLNVNMTAANNQAHTLRVFAGNANNIAAMQSFAIAFPGCIF